MEKRGIKNITDIKNYLDNHKDIEGKFIIFRCTKTFTPHTDIKIQIGPKVKK